MSRFRGAALRPRRAGLCAPGIPRRVYAREGSLWDWQRQDGRGRCRRTGRTPVPLGRAYDIAVGGVVFTAMCREWPRRKARRSVPRRAASGRSGLTTWRRRCPGPAVNGPGTPPALRSAIRTCLGLLNSGPAAVHDLHPGTGPPGWHRIPARPSRPADGRMRRAAVLSGPGLAPAGGHAVRFREDSPRELARARAAVAAWRGQPGGNAASSYRSGRRPVPPGLRPRPPEVLFAADRHRARNITEVINGQAGTAP